MFQEGPKVSLSLTTDGTRQEEKKGSRGWYISGGLKIKRRSFWKGPEGLLKETSSSVHEEEFNFQVESVEQGK